ncbi:TetR-like C-terminal domain-containing protein [Nocardioides pacificus]
MPISPDLPEDTTVARPRVEGDREVEILRAALAVLSDVGYDRLTMDAVATAAKASKATLYRRWDDKASLVIDAVLQVKSAPHTPDTGSLRGDLLEAFCGLGGLMGPESNAAFAGLITALHRDPALAEQFRERVVAPKLDTAREIYSRAAARGEVREDLDLDLLGPALAGILIHRLIVLGEQPTPERVARVIDQIILPAARPDAPPATLPADRPHSSKELS